jgi:hypothetical protein
MRTAMKNVFLAASLAALAIPVIAQVTRAAARSKSPSSKPTVQQRKKHPQKHVAHDVQNRKRTAGEAAPLKRKEAGASAKERAMREDNRERLTSADRANLQRQQNRTSKAIDHKKHNAIVSSAHAKSAAGPRPQQHRTAKLKTGQLTTRQAAHLETKETSFRHQIHSDRKQDGGNLTPEDQTNPQQDKSTNQIHLKEHNARMF